MSRGTCEGAPGQSTFYALDMQRRGQTTEKAGDGDEACVGILGRKEPMDVWGWVATVFCATKNVAEYSSNSLGFEPGR